MRSDQRQERLQHGQQKKGCDLIKDVTSDEQSGKLYEHLISHPETYNFGDYFFKNVNGKKIKFTIAGYTKVGNDKNYKGIYLDCEEIKDKPQSKVEHI